MKRNSLLSMLLLLGAFCFEVCCQTDSLNNTNIKNNPEIELLVPTFLGNEKRNYYGNNAPDSLHLLWKHYLGKGKTVISRKAGAVEWAGAGWTGQPLIIKEDGKMVIMQGAYDHHLKKMNASTGEIIWQYAFDDVIKGTATLWKTPDTVEFNNRYVLFQGSRLGEDNFLDSKHVPSYRAVSYITGKELWRLDVKWDASYSRDVDASCLVINDTLYIGLENGIFTVMDPFYQNASIKDNMLQPKIIQERKLYKPEDKKIHRGNLVTESSPALLNNHLYIASGSGHIWGYSLEKKEIVWDFFTGSDMDGSPVVTHDSCLIVTVERQYIPGKGGAFKLDPSKSPDESVVWFLPVENREHAGWEGGIIGSAGINDSYHTGELPYLAAVNAIDGNMYVVEHTVIDSSKKVPGPNLKYKYYTPKLVYKKLLGASISTPIFDKETIISAGYGGLYLFKYNPQGEIKLKDKFQGYFEATPSFYDNMMFIASRNGYLYCLGNGE